MKLTKDFSQCQDCVFCKINQGVTTCNYGGEEWTLAAKYEDCPNYASMDEAIQSVLNKREYLKRAEREEQERLEREKREKEECERTHPKEFWTLFYLENYPLCYEITSHYEENGSPYPVDNNRSHWTGENNEDVVYYYSTEEKAYQKYKEVLEEYIKDAEAELLEMRERLTYLKAHGLIK